MLSFRKKLYSFYSQKSRHSSGASNKNVKLDKRIDDIIPKLHLEEDSYLNKIKFDFIHQYVHYLESEFSFKSIAFLTPDSGLEININFSTLHLTNLVYSPPTSKPLPRRRNSFLQSNLQYLTYLQKAVFLGGIVLLEIGFSSGNFVVSVYAYECNRYVNCRQVPYHSDLFTKDCDKYKEITHVHSFSNDFHLRLLYLDIAAIFEDRKAGVDFDIITFLHSLVNYFQYPPTFARNYVVRGNLQKMNDKI